MSLSKWLLIFLLLTTGCCGSDKVQQSQVVDTTIRIPRDTISLKTDYSIEKAAKLDGNLEISLEQQGREQLRDTLQYIHNQYRALIRKTTNDSATGKLIRRYSQSRATIQALRDSLVVLKAKATKRKDSIRVVEKTEVEKQTGNKSRTNMLILLLAGLVTGIALVITYQNVTD